MHERCHVSTDMDLVRQFKCLDCASESKLWRDCTSHMWKEHKIDIDLLKCPFCPFKAVFAGKSIEMFILSNYEVCCSIKKLKSS